MIFGIITQVLRFYLGKNYSSEEGNILWIWKRHTHTLTYNGFDTKGIKQALHKEL